MEGHFLFFIFSTADADFEGHTLVSVQASLSAAKQRFVIFHQIFRTSITEDARKMATSSSEFKTAPVPQRNDFPEECTGGTNVKGGSPKCFA